MNPGFCGHNVEHPWAAHSGVPNGRFQVKCKPPTHGRRFF